MMFEGQDPQYPHFYIYLEETPGRHLPFQEQSRTVIDCSTGLSWITERSLENLGEYKNG